MRPVIVAAVATRFLATHFPTALSNAALSGSASRSPLRSLRSSIPAAALELSEYRSSTGVCRSGDNEDSTPTLGDSEELRIKHFPLDVIKPCVGQCSDKDCEIASFI